MHTPELMPILSKGAHTGPTEGACVMEMVSYLAGEVWSDSPACTHPVLASMARVVNDRLPDSERHRLVPLIGRLFGTSAPVDEHEAHVLSVRLAVWCARRVLDLVRPEDRVVVERAIVAAEGWCEGLVTVEEARAAAYAAANAAAYAAAANAAANAAAAAYAAAYAAYAAANAAANAAAYAANAAANAAAYAANAAAAERMVDQLTGLIDEYDRLTGRNQHHTVTADELTRLAALTT